MSINEFKEDSPPGFLSVEFHIRFFPSLLFGRLSSGQSVGTGFTSTLDHYVFLAFCLILLIIGIPGAVHNNSIVGWILVGIGAAGIIAMFISSILSGIGRPPSYDDFLKGIFFFFLALGLSTGIFIGTLEHSLLKGTLIGSAGLVAGYPLGILSGLCFQYLGWLAVLLNMLAYLAVFGMLCVDIVILGGNLF